LSLAAETAGLAGWLEWDKSDASTSARYFQAGLEAARDSGDAALGAYLLGSAACQPSYSEQPYRRLELLADRSHGFSCADGTSATRAWLATLEAEAHVLAGDEHGCRDALARAENSFAVVDDADSRPRVTFFNSAYLKGECGLSLARLGHTEEARPLLHSALSDLPAEQQKGRPRLLTALGTAYLRTGEVEEACRLGSEALDLARKQGVEPNLRDVRELRRRLEPWSDSPTVSRFDEQFRTTA